MNKDYKNNKDLYIYSHSSVPWQQQILTDFLSLIPIKKDLHCLDAGCGIGNNLHVLQNFFNNITACDISKKAMDYRKNQFNKSTVNFVQADIERLPFRDDHFDVVVCTEVIEHVNDSIKARDELLRVLKKDNGYLIISTPNYFNLAGLVKLIMDKFLGSEKWDVWGDVQKENKENKEAFMTCFKLKRLFSQKKTKIIKDQSGDFLNSWFLFLPFVYRNFKLTDKYPFLWIGKFPFFKKIGMNYFIIIKTNLSQQKDLPHYLIF
jgi:2-polyprenyl-3-methyl-5-hydroxy-6-metoxy-1,4-benzoquinol methylase